jgi:hypothetical protein
MPCRVDLFHCVHCGGEHYYQNECLTDPSKRGEGLLGYTGTKTFNIEGALCDVLSLLEDKMLLSQANLPQDILNWWDEHQSKEREKIKKEALEKLSPKEKRALGL